MVYLIHLDKPLAGRSQHYIGFCDGGEAELAARIDRHRHGDGSKFLRAATQQGISWKVVRTWPDGDRNFERRLKNRHNHWQLCPLCGKKHKAAFRRERRRAA